eukprot:RCo039253
MSRSAMPRSPMAPPRSPNGPQFQSSPTSGSPKSAGGLLSPAHAAAAVAMKPVSRGGGRDYEAMKAYLPRVLRGFMTTHSMQASTNLRFHASCVFADVSGFTRVTEELKKQPDGAELISMHLCKYFTRVIEIVHDAGGDVVTFCGDAVLAVWPYHNDAEKGSAITLAARCAHGLGQNMASYSIPVPNSSETLSLALHVGVGCGECAMMLVGHHKTLKALFLGRAVDSAAEMCKMAKKDQVIISGQVSSHIMDTFLAEPMKPDLGGSMAGYLLTGLEPGAVAVEKASFLAEAEVPDMREQIRKAATLLVDLVYRAPQECVGQLRTVSTVFIKLLNSIRDPLNNDELGSIDTAIGTIQKKAQHLDGVCDKVVFDDKGLVALYVFGLPYHSHEDDAQRSVNFALSISRSLERVIGAVCIGITRSKVFCGNLGAAARMEYTVLGDGVNMAARLMSYTDPAAPRLSAQIIVDEETSNACPETEFGPVKQIHLKGKAAPVKVREPLAEQPRMSRHRRPSSRGSFSSRSSRSSASSARSGSICSAREIREARRLERSTTVHGNAMERTNTMDELCSVTDGIGEDLGGGGDDEQGGVMSLIMESTRASSVVGALPGMSLSGVGSMGGRQTSRSQSGRGATPSTASTSGRRHESIPSIPLIEMDKNRLFGREPEFVAITNVLHGMCSSGMLLAAYAISNPDLASTQLAEKAKSSRIVLLSGDCGVGKSALLNWTVSMCESLSIDFLMVEGVELERATPFFGLGSLLDQIVHNDNGKVDVSFLPPEQALHAAVLAEVLPDRVWPKLPPGLSSRYSIGSSD